MSQWFYAEGNRERRGPLPAASIVELFHSRRIAGDTLLWREGATDWRPLSEFADELGLDMPPGQPVAPPLPPRCSTRLPSSRRRRGPDCPGAPWPAWSPR